MSRTLTLALAALIALSSVHLCAEAKSSKKKPHASKTVQRKTKAAKKSSVAKTAKSRRRQKVVQAAPKTRRSQKVAQAASKSRHDKKAKVVQAAKGRGKARKRLVAAAPQPKPRKPPAAPKAKVASPPTAPKVVAAFPKSSSPDSASAAPGAPTLSEKKEEVEPAKSDVSATPTSASPAGTSTPEPPKPQLTTAPQKVFVAENEFPLPAAARLVKDEVLAPLVDALPQLGAKAEFRASDKSLHIESATGKKLSLYADNPNVIVDEKNDTFPVAPTFDGTNFFLPVFATAKALGYAARVDNAGGLHLYPTLTAVEVKPNEQEVEVKMILSAPAKYTVNQIQDPTNKVFVDLAQTVLALPQGEAWKGDGDVQRVRVGQFTDAPPVTRVVVDTKRLMGFIVRKTEKPNEVVVALSLAAMPQLPVVVVVGDELKDLKIVVDAGHGGKDPGASGPRGTQEKDITLDIALRLQKALMERGATVLMTRTGDTYPTLADRVVLANNSGVHLFVSVHVNAYSRPNTMSGTMVLYATPQSSPLARCILNRLLAELQRTDRGVRYRPNLYVLHHTVMPSVIAEVAYVDNNEEEALLNDPQFRQRAAEAIANGVVDYVKR